MSCGPVASVVALGLDLVNATLGQVKQLVQMHGKVIAKERTTVIRRGGTAVRLSQM